MIIDISVQQLQYTHNIITCSDDLDLHRRRKADLRRTPTILQLRISSIWNITWHHVIYTIHTQTQNINSLKCI